MKLVQIPALPTMQNLGWIELGKLSRKFKDDWTLIGGQLIQLHCWERGAQPTRVTNDVDAVLNVVANPEILRKVTSYLTQNGFSPAGTTNDGHQYKWVKDGAEFDLLFPDNIGARAGGRTGITGATTLETPGGKQVFDFDEKIEILLEGENYLINRPNIWGALFIKTKAVMNASDTGKERHLEDLAMLSTLITTEDSKISGHRFLKRVIETGIGYLRAAPDILAKVPGSDEGLQRIELILDI